MSRKNTAKSNRGFFAVGVYNPKTEANIGSLYRTAFLYDAAYVFTIGRRYVEQASDTPKTARQIPLFHFDSIEDALKYLPRDTKLVGVELDDRSVSLPTYKHPERAAYLMGAEDSGIPAEVLGRCHDVLQLPSTRAESMNVSVAGSIVIYDRFIKRSKD